MAGLDDLYAQIPTAEIANKLGAGEGEVEAAVHTLVPVLLSGLQQNSQDPEHAGRIVSAASGHADRGLLDAGLDQVDEGDGHQAVATLFGGNDTNQVASALADGGAGDSELLKRLLPVLVPIVLAYIGKRLSSTGAAESSASQEKASGGLGEVLGSILGGSGDKSLGSILGSVLAGKGGKGGALGDILGGLLGGKK
ncbi:DUF937 domain-containing protein [Mycobacterium riyadhense]|uniref:DUF937 domain-containing protein n=1 Tax=Mycobacterium riyadhense TaxID=486698 RepID=A0A1X2D951_9MYCO|nr:DUF937 domain-containing protein [Mycobacterium riyadhense]MCV7148953.1 DUF937 domain-containing protein [Mycobacterium riyadhense]ORW84279.1 hypothetical protein AWC22_13340 [Mycobacterium riyadhense]VTP04074.1 hypothetical protein BIN_B_05382 [Mycobacterium riyadhense]